MSKSEQSGVFFLSPAAAEWAINISAYCEPTLGLARAVSRATRKAAAPFLPVGFYENVPETLRDCLDSGKGLPDYVSAARIARTVLSENKRRIPIELSRGEQRLLQESATTRCDLYLRMPLPADAGDVRYQAHELEAVAGILDVLGPGDQNPQVQRPTE